MTRRDAKARPSAGAELLRYALVGLLQNSANLVIFTGALALGIAYWLCAGVAAIAALVLSFVLNRRFTFTQSGGAVGHQLWRYVVVVAASISAGIGVLVLAVEVGRLGAVVGQLVAIVAVAPPSYLAQKHWTFRR
ncbi:MAG: GtrA family protein [Solirubrobacteraceae bacterium]